MNSYFLPESLLIFFFCVCVLVSVCVLCIIDAVNRLLLTLKASFPVQGCVSGSITPPLLCCLTLGASRVSREVPYPPISPLSLAAVGTTAE